MQEPVTSRQLLPTSRDQFSVFSQEQQKMHQIHHKFNPFINFDNSINKLF